MLELNEEHEIVHKNENEDQDYMSKIPVNGIPGWDFPELHGVSSPILIATTILLVILSIILVVISNQIT
mgnify:FL=1